MTNDHLTSPLAQIRYIFYLTNALVHYKVYLQPHLQDVFCV